MAVTPGLACGGGWGREADAPQSCGRIRRVLQGPQFHRPFRGDVPHADPSGPVGIGVVASLPAGLPTGARALSMAQAAISGEREACAMATGDETGTVETARGPIAASELGHTLMHEHVFIEDMEVRRNYPTTWGDDGARMTSAILKFNELKSLGVDTVVDLTVMGLGRDVPRLVQVAAETSVNIVVATGI